MGGNKTSNNFYRRGVANNNSFFGFAVQGNYPIIQPQYLYRPNLYSNTTTPPPPTPIPPDPDTPTSLSSILFDGSQNYLEYPGITLGTTAFTIQCWVQLNNINGRQNILGSTNPEGVYDGLSFALFGNNSVRVDYLADNTYIFDISNNLISVLETNTWYYFAFVRDASNNATLYIGEEGSPNAGISSTGVVVRTYGSSPPPSKVQGQPIDFNITNKIGAWQEVQGQSPNSFLNGYLSNLCVTSGALFDPTSQTTIPIPTSPFTATENTLLLLNTTSEETTFIDSSPNQFTITGMGNPIPQVSVLSPF